MTADWWSDEANLIGEPDDSPSGVGKVYARQVDSEWEYAYVWWRYGTPSIRWTLRGGKYVEPE